MCSNILTEVLMKNSIVSGLRFISQGVEYGVVLPLKFLSEKVRGDQYEVIRWYPSEESAEDLSAPWRRRAAIPFEVLLLVVGMPPLALLEGTITRLQDLE